MLANAVKLTEKAIEKTTWDFRTVTYREKC